MTAKEREKLRAVIRYPNPSFSLYPSEYAPKPILGVPFDDINDPARTVQTDSMAGVNPAGDSRDDSTDDLDDRECGRTVVSSCLGDKPATEGPAPLRRSELHRIAFINNLYALERRMR